MNFSFNIEDWRNNNYDFSILNEKSGDYEHKFYATKRQVNGLKKSLDFFNHDDRKVTLRKMFEVNPYDFFYKVNSKESGEVASAIR